MQSNSEQRFMHLAFQAIQQDVTMPFGRAATIYKVPQATLHDHLHSTLPRRHYTPKSTKLLRREGYVVVQHIHDLDAQGLPPQLAPVADMANPLRTERYMGQVGVNRA
jgi:hypothetical protein